MSARRVRLLYFAAVRELVALESEDVALPDDVQTVADLATFVGARHPALAPHLSSVRFAVNEEFADGTSTIDDGATVALIPPVAGG